MYNQQPKELNNSKIFGFLNYSDTWYDNKKVNHFLILSKTDFGCFFPNQKKISITWSRYQTNYIK